MPLDAARDAVIAVQARVIEALAAENARLTGQVAGLAARVERLERLDNWRLPRISGSYGAITGSLENMFNFRQPRRDAKLFLDPVTGQPLRHHQHSR
jgi:hypothetical protein